MISLFVNSSQVIKTAGITLNLTLMDSRNIFLDRFALNIRRKISCGSAVSDTDVPVVNMEVVLYKFVWVMYGLGLWMLQTGLHCIGTRYQKCYLVICFWFMEVFRHLPPLSFSIPD